MIRLAVIGDQRVIHSLSPRMHNAVLKEEGLAGSYVAIPVEADQLGAFLGSLAGGGFAGVNVTVPHKQAVLPFLDHLGEEATTLGAVNTIVVKGERLEGGNTDCPGFAQALTETGYAASGRPALVVGAGGAARSVVLALARLGAAPLWVAARRPAQARALCAELGGEAIDMEQAALAVADARLLVNAAAASSPKESPELAAWAGSLNASRLEQVMDINYGRNDNFWAELAQAHDARFADGLVMLAHQAALSFTRWTGRPVAGARFLAALEGAA
ncbi:MAG: shikimate dehydrogenase [Proteobacteria bacterium]|nr:shikimate dehydrogenase [Pseudomonadota bacterium]MBU1449666.1 shikimate dehydrogenase [Pseudomonadota bacterium]MBU2469919.1 shikimate dehydrogenase [Pseudomonadota bacterium]MBU2516917.1 shikimate dehydrogenase [Pseudomonadota bacterium]